MRDVFDEDVTSAIEILDQFGTSTQYQPRKKNAGSRP
jgi:hypothetical protein